MRASCARRGVWLLAPTWIAVNAFVGVWTSQSIFQLVQKPRPGFEAQLLMGGFAPAQVSIGLAVWLVVFFAGLLYWGNRFKRFRRTTIIAIGIGGGLIQQGALYALNHSASWGMPAQAGLALVAAAGLFVLAGATPAALGLLADISESHPADRGAIMGLYSVFLALGQITGSLIGGGAAQWAGIDGLMVAGSGCSWSPCCRSVRCAAASTWLAPGRSRCRRRAADRRRAPELSRPERTRRAAPRGGHRSGTRPDRPDRRTG